MKVCILGLSLGMEQDLVEIEEAGLSQICLDTVIIKSDLELKIQMILIYTETEVLEEQSQEEADQEVSSAEARTVGEAEVVVKLGM